MKYSQNQLNQFKSFWNDISSSGLQLEADHSNVSIPYNKKGNKIHIKKENEGKFTAYCNGKVTNACIQKGKSSSDPKIRKRATFAANARTWNSVQKHQWGGIFKLARPLLRKVLSFKKIIKGPDGKIFNSDIIRNPDNFYRGVDRRAIMDAKKTKVIRGSEVYRKNNMGAYFGRGREPWDTGYIIESKPGVKFIKVNSYNPERSSGNAYELFPEQHEINWTKRNPGKEIYNNKNPDVRDALEMTWAGMPVNEEMMFNKNPISSFKFYKRYPLLGFREINI